MAEAMRAELCNVQQLLRQLHAARCTINRHPPDPPGDNLHDLHTTTKQHFVRSWRTACVSGPVCAGATETVLAEICIAGAQPGELLERSGKLCKQALPELLYR